MTPIKVTRLGERVKQPCSVFLSTFISLNLMFLFKLLLVGLGNWVVSHHDTSELLFTHLSLLQRFINIYCDWLIVDLSPELNGSKFVPSFD